MSKPLCGVSAISFHWFFVVGYETELRYIMNWIVEYSVQFVNLKIMLHTSLQVKKYTTKNNKYEK